MNVGEYLVHALKGHGVTTLFGVPGEQGIALYDAVRRDPEVTHVGMRDERNVGYAAIGYARVCGRVGVLDVTVGPGTAMLPLALLEALHSATPLVVLVSDAPVRLDPYAYRGALSQGMDQWGFLTDLTKWRGKAWRSDHVPVLIRRAFQEATSGAPGPTAVIIPQDVYDADAPETTADASVGDGYPSVRAVPAAGDIDVAAGLLDQARRPFLVAGGGVLHSAATAELAELAGTLTGATATTFTGVGAVTDDYPHHVGLLGDIGTDQAESMARAADVVLVVGFRGAGNSTLLWTFPDADQRVIHLDIDPTAPGRYGRCDVALVGDARETLRLLRERVQPTVSREEWASRASSERERWLAQRSTAERADDKPITPQRVMGELSAVVGEGVIVADASFASGWVGLHARVPRAGRRAVLPRGMAGLGFGLPAGIGAKAGAADHPVWVIAGDGGFGYSLGELTTLLQHGLTVNMVVLNNRSWGWMDWGSQLRFGQQYFPLLDVSYAAAAGGLGLHAVRIEDPAELAPALRAAADVNRPAVVEVVTELWESPLRSHQRAVSGGAESAA